jgi:hypothetical protein
MENFKYKIEHDFPVPDRSRSDIKYPFMDMKRGNSFAVPVDPATDLNYIKTSNRVCAALVQYCRGSYSRWFMTRLDRKREEVRVFCVADGHKDWRRSLK